MASAAFELVDFSTTKTNTAATTTPPQTSNNNAAATIVNLMNTVVGVGILSMPFFFLSGGLLLGPLLLTFVLGMTDASLRLLLSAGELAGVQEIQEVARVLFPRHGDTYAKIVDACVVIMNFGSCVAYMDVVADLCVAWFGERWRATSLLLAIIAIILPLSLIEKINSLRFTSYVGIAIYCTFALTAGALFALGYGAEGADSPAAPPTSDGGGSDDTAADVAKGVGLYGTGQLLVAFPIVVFAFACHTVIFHIRVEFTGAGATSGAFRSAMRKALVACFLIYAGVGLFGCLSFGFRVKGDVLKNYSALAVDPASVARHGTVIARAMEGFFCISVCLTYPLVVFPLRASLLNLLLGTGGGGHGGRGGHGADAGDGLGGVGGVGRGAVARGNHSRRRSALAFCCRWADYARARYGRRGLFFGCTIVILAVSYATAILLPQLEVVLGLSGATMGVAICYVYPALMYLRATDGRSRSPLSPVRRRLKGASTSAASGDSMHVPLRDDDGNDTAVEAGGGGGGSGGKGHESSSTGSSDFDDAGDHAEVPPPASVPSIPRWVAYAVLFVSIPAGFASFVQAVAEINEKGGE